MKAGDTYQAGRLMETKVAGRVGERTSWEHRIMLLEQVRLLPEQGFLEKSGEGGAVGAGRPRFQPSRCELHLFFLVCLPGR